jgi:hypothetical protein
VQRAYLLELHKRGLLNPAAEAARYTTPLEWLDAVRPVITNPTLGDVPCVPRPYQREVLEAWQERLRLVVKSRQIGFSQIFALEAYCKAAHLGRPLIVCLGHNEDSAMEFIRYARMGAEADGAKLKTDNASELELANGHRIIAQAATARAGRSKAASDIYLDEFAWTEWHDRIYTAVKPTIATGGTATVFSSPNGKGNTFYQIWDGQLGPWRKWDMPYSVLFDEEWAESQKATMTRESFAQEYMGAAGFEAAGTSVFLSSDVDACFAHGVQQEWQSGRRYRLYTDPAGSGADATVVYVVDVTETPYRIVARERWTEGPFEVLYQTVERLATAYKVQKVRVEKNGLGATMPEELENRLRPHGISVEGFDITPKSKINGLTALMLLVERHHLLFDDEQLRRELKLYQRDDKKLIQDCVMTMLNCADDMHTIPEAGHTFAARNPILRLPRKP